MTEREVSSERVSEERLLEIIEWAKRYGEDARESCNVHEMWDMASELLALRSSVKTVGVDIADTCDGVEQEAFEAWAKAAGHDMHEHPMHYLFLDPKTDAARTGWKAGITHARQRILSAIEAPAAASEVTDEMVQKAWEAYDAKSGYSKPERFRAALTAALKGGK